MSGKCLHHVISFDSSRHVASTKYRRVDEDRRIAATQTSGRVPEDPYALRVPQSTFPAPLILPQDELAFYGTYPPQSVRSWFRGEWRNEVTPDRQTIYVVALPGISDEVSYMRNWAQPQVQSKPSKKTKAKSTARTKKEIPHPHINDIVQYFEAFYHGMPVQTFDHPWNFTSWTTSDRPQRPDQRNAVALETNKSAVRIRTRASLDGCFERQLNLSDLLDACLEAVPEDAYALILLVEQDMFEDEDDDFCCGRAFGGSRVAVVSTARYNPLLDDMQGVEREHAWPASHCATYMETCCAEDDSDGDTTKIVVGKEPLRSSAHQNVLNRSAVRAAIDASTALPSLTRNPSSARLSGLWLGRVCKTAVHEVGHCLNMDHCVYYACIMQGTANICEDARQPPYLCPVDLAKFATATGTSVVGRYNALLGFCNQRLDVHLFAAFAAWLTVRLSEIQLDSAA